MSNHFTFPRADRLTKKTDYARVFSTGEKYVGRYFVCYVVQRTGSGSRLGFAVSRKVGNAVVRNRVKRYLREFYRTHRGAFKIEAELVIIARPAVAAAPYRDCVYALTRLLQRGGVLNG